MWSTVPVLFIKFYYAVLEGIAIFWVKENSIRTFLAQLSGFSKEFLVAFSDSLSEQMDKPRIPNVNGANLRVGDSKYSVAFSVKEKRWCRRYFCIIVNDFIL